MLSKKMLNGLNDQITKEMFSSYFYLQIAGWLENKSLAGIASWMKVQAQEEMAHGMIFYNYINERGGAVSLSAIDAPPKKYKSVMDIFKRFLAHEELVTQSINNLMAIAIKENDFATKARLDWFITEQVEEESNATDLIGKLELAGENSSGLFLLDKELSARIFVLPSPLAAQ